MYKPSRRKFIRQATAAAIAAPFISTSVTRALAQGSRQKIGFAICGLGGLSRGQIAPALQKTRHCRLTGIITDSPDKAGEWKSRYKIPDRSVYTYDSMDKMVDNPDIDAVFVVTPNALHADHTIKAAKAGKHVLCEKPMEVSVEKCQQMIDACKEAKRLLAIGYRCQFEPHHLECMRLAREKVFGDVKIIEAGFGFTMGDPDQWRLKRALAGGGALMDVGVYAVQATRYITGEEPLLVSATETKTDPVKFREVDESIAWQAKFPSGVVAYCATTYNATGINRFRAHAERGWFGLDPAFNYSGVRGSRSDGRALAFPQIDHFAAQMDDFALCILDNKPSRVAGEEGLKDVKVMMAIYESIRTGKTINLA